MELNQKTTSVKCQATINETEIQVIVDTGAATTIISNKLLEELGLTIQEPSKAVFIIANGGKTASLGKTEIELEIGDWIIPITAEIIESRNKDLIIGTKTLSQYKGKIDLEQKKVILNTNEDQIEIPIYYTKEEMEEVSDDDDDEYSDEYEETDEEVEILITHEENEQEIDQQQKNEQVLAEPTERP